VFSQRTAVERHPNRLATALEKLRTQQTPFLDLTVSNPTTAGLPYPTGEIRAALSDPRALTYSPDPFGLRSARAAISVLYAETGVAVPPEHLVLTASTSEAYGYLWKLLCDANTGDEVLVPAPSYPLFELLARFEGVTLVPYRLAYDGEWHIDRESVKHAITPRTRAIMMVSPNNPTGSYVREDELEMLASFDLPLVSDEVFAPFPLRAERQLATRRAKSVLESRSADLVFALNGLSKLAALPQMKLGWLAVGGRNAARVAEALARLELLADAFLSVGAPIQVAAPTLLSARHVTIAAIQARLAKNLAVLQSATTGTALSLLDVEGGWYGTLRLPRVESEEAWVLRFLQEDHVYVHPGHFFDFAEEAYVVLSLLTAEEPFAEGVRRIVARVASLV